MKDNIREDEHESYTVVVPMNGHGAATLRDGETRATYHVVEYGSPSLRERVADLSAGSVVRLELSRAGGRANVWRAERAASDASETGRTTDSSGGRRVGSEA